MEYNYTIETTRILSMALNILNNYDRAGEHVYSYTDGCSPLDIARMEVGTSADPTGSRYKALKAKWHVVLAADAMTAEEDAATAIKMAEEAETIARCSKKMEQILVANTAREWAQSAAWTANQRNRQLKTWFQENGKIPASLSFKKL